MRLVVHKFSLIILICETVPIDQFKNVNEKVSEDKTRGGTHTQALKLMPRVVRRVTLLTPSESPMQ